MTSVLLQLTCCFHLITPLQISILSVAETVRSCSLDQCYKSLLSPATSETKRKMSTFISNIKASDGATQHAAGFQKAFQLLRNTSSLCKQSTSKKTILWNCDTAYQECVQLPFFLQHNQLSGHLTPYELTWALCLCLSSATDMVIIYLSSGITSRESSEQEKRATLSVVREENRHLNNSVMILTYALMNGRLLVL